MDRKNRSLSLRVLGCLLLLMLFFSAFRSMRAEESRVSILQKSMNMLTELLAPNASDIPGRYTCLNTNDSTLTLTIFPDGTFRQTSTGFSGNISIDGKWSHVSPVLSADGVLSEDYLILNGHITIIETPAQHEHSLINTPSNKLSLVIKATELTLQKRPGEIRCSIIKPPLLATRIYIDEEWCYIKR